MHLSRLVLASAIALTGCAHTATTSFDPSALPEESAAPPTAADPRAVLEAGAATLEPQTRGHALRFVVSAGWGPEWDARALGDPSGWVQRQAVEALAVRQDAAARELLRTFVAQPNADPSARAVAALRLDDPSVAEHVAAAWKEERTLSGRVALGLAAVVYGHDAARQSLTTLLAKGRLPYEPWLLLEIGHSGHTELLEPLRSAQVAVEEELRLSVAGARLLLGDQTAEDVFRKALGSSVVEQRLEALDVLVELPPDMVKGLLVRARSQGPDIVTHYATLALAARAGGDNDAFTEAAIASDREVRELAVQFAAEAATNTTSRKVLRAARKVVIDGLADPSPQVRVAALRGVYELGIIEVRSQVEALLGDEHSRVRLHAAGATMLLPTG